jgi:hypothetical protein
MEQTEIVGLSVTGEVERITDFHDSPFCAMYVLAQMLGLEQISENVMRGSIESYTVPSVKISRHRVSNLHRIRRDLDRGKTIFCSGDYAEASHA